MGAAGGSGGVSKLYEAQKRAVLTEYYALHCQNSPVSYPLGAAGGSGGVSKLYEAQERAVLTEYHDVLVKLADRAAQKQKDAQLPGMQRISREAATSSRPLSAPASMTDAPQQLMSGGVSQGDVL